jgi:hypothetical protein
MKRREYYEKKQGHVKEERNKISNDNIIKKKTW